MRLLFAVFLYALHFSYSLILKLRSIWEQRSPTHPQPLLTKRRRIPRHLAILFVADSCADTHSSKSALTESILRSIEWCRLIGIKKLTVFEEKDLLSQCVNEIRTALPNRELEVVCSDSEEEYHPPTPPPSDYSNSRSLSPDTDFVHVTTMRIAKHIPKKSDQRVRRRRQLELESEPHKTDLLLCLALRVTSKPAIASAAQTLAKSSATCIRTFRSQKQAQFSLSVDELDTILEDEDGLSSPEFMIIHHLAASCRIGAPPELHGFPPWQIRLTEIYHQRQQHHRIQDWWNQHAPFPQTPSILDETTFRKALDEFSTAEMRFGK